MAVSATFLDFVLEQLEHVAGVSSRRMFGGVGLYSDGVFFAVLDNDTLFFKVDDRTRPDYVAAGSGPFRPYPDKPDAAMHGYYEVPAAVLEDRDDLARWANLAVNAGAGSVGTKRGRRRDADRASRGKPARKQH